MFYWSALGNCKSQGIQNSVTKTTFDLLGNQGFVSSTFYLVQILVHSHFDLVGSGLVQFATKTVIVSQMAPEMISSVNIFCTSKEIGTKPAFLFYVTHFKENV